LAAQQHEQHPSKAWSAEGKQARRSGHKSFKRRDRERRRLSVGTGSQSVTQHHRRASEHDDTTRKAIAADGHRRSSHNQACANEQAEDGHSGERRKGRTRGHEGQPERPDLPNPFGRPNYGNQHAGGCQAARDPASGTNQHGPSERSQGESHKSGLDE
jgi:hypothetical protein